MSFNKLVNIYNSNRKIKFESFLSSLSIEMGADVDFSAIYWFSKDIKRKSSVSRPIKLTSIDDFIYFFDHNGSLLFKISSYQSDYLNSLDSSLKTSLFPNPSGSNYYFSNDQFIVGKHGLYEDYSNNHSFSNYRYITFRDDHSIDFESFIDLNRSKMTKIYYKKNGDVDSKLTYHISKKDNIESSLSSASNRISKFIDENYPDLSTNTKNKLYDEFIDDFYYEKNLIDKKTRYKDFYLSKFSTIYSDRDIDCIPYLDRVHISGVKNRNIESCEFISNFVNPHISLLTVGDFANGNLLKKDIISYPSSLLREWFSNLDVNEVKSDSILLKGFENKIKYINDSLTDYLSSYKKKHQKKIKSRVVGSAYSAALIGNYNTFIFNVGDTRAYILKDDELKQITYDDTIVWDLYKDKSITYDEAFDYQRGAKLTKYLGKTKDFCPNIISVNNDDYDQLFLLSDGVIDYLNNTTIQSIINVNSKEDVLNEIALLSNSKHIKHDDVSGCCYIKSKK